MKDWFSAHFYCPQIMFIVSIRIVLERIALICANIYRIMLSSNCVIFFLFFNSTELHFPLIRSSGLNYFDFSNKKIYSNRSCITWKIDSFRFNIFNLLWLIWHFYNGFFSSVMKLYAPSILIKKKENSWITLQFLNATFWHTKIDK